jgi:hypothetical protein
MKTRYKVAAIVISILMVLGMLLPFLGVFR